MAQRSMPGVTPFISAIIMALSLLIFFSRGVEVPSRTLKSQFKIGGGVRHASTIQMMSRFPGSNNIFLRNRQSERFNTFKSIEEAKAPLRPEWIVSAGRRGGKGRRGAMEGRTSNDDGLTINDQITFPEVRVIDEQKQMIGVLPVSDALVQAKSKAMDLILLNPTAEPPLCRIMKIDKYRYELKRAEKEKSKQQRAARVDVKELKLRPNTDVHDYQVRLKKAIQFLKQGDRVKISCQFKGREMAYQNLGREMMQKFLVDLDGLGTGNDPKMSGRTMVMIVTPVKSKKQANAGNPTKKDEKSESSGDGENTDNGAQDTQREESVENSRSPDATISEDI